MPELPEVETVRRTLLPYVVGRTFVKVHVVEPRLRWRVDVTALKTAVLGQTVVGLRRRGKYLLFDMSNQSVMCVHLGMTGWLGVVAAEQPMRKHDHVAFNLDSCEQLRFNDARRFGSVAVFSRACEHMQPRLQILGPEPLDPTQFCGDVLFAKSRKVQKNIKAWLMDASVVVGVGNIYASEALFRAGIAPGLRSKRLSRIQASCLAEAVVTTLEGALVDGGTTLRNFTNADGEAGRFKVRLKVYGRQGEPCVRCHTLIKRVTTAGRSTFYCPTCQSRTKLSVAPKL